MGAMMAAYMIQAGVCWNCSVLEQPTTPLTGLAISAGNDQQEGTHLTLHTDATHCSYHTRLISMTT